MQRVLIFTVGMLLLVACARPTATPPTAAPSNPAPANSAYPSPEVAYPTPLPPGAYPAPTATPPQGPAFTINSPIRATDTNVNGTGPAGVPIRLIDIAKSGETVATTVIRDDGTYSFEVAGRLVAGNRVALVLGDTSGTSIDRSQFNSGPGYQDFPLIGILFASAPVE